VDYQAVLLSGRLVLNRDPRLGQPKPNSGSRSHQYLGRLALRSIDASGVTPRAVNQARALAAGKRRDPRRRVRKGQAATRLPGMRRGADATALGEADRCALCQRLVAQTVEGDAEDVFDLTGVASDLADSDHHLHHLRELDVRPYGARVLRAF
jgi:hypothetical protein